MSALERIIRTVSPAWAVRRAAARAQLDELERFSAYRGAEHRRWDRAPPAWRGTSANWEQEQGYDRRELVDRSRQLQRSSVLAQALLEASTLSVVGCGFPLQASSSSPALNEDAEGLWRDWAERGADSRSMSTLDELAALWHTSRNRDGDVGIVLQPDGTIRSVESDEIATLEGPFRPDKGVDGIDLDRNGRPLQYWVVADANQGYSDRRSQGPVVAIPPERMLFWSRRQRLGQTRGIPALSAVAWILDQIDGQIEATTTAARMAACFGLIFKREARFNASGLGGLTTATDSHGQERKRLGLEPGQFMELDPGESIEQINPTHPSTDFAAFIRLLTRLVARPFGLPLEIALLDFSEATFSSSRGALLEAWKTWRRDQAALKRILSRLYAWQLARWVESGKLRGSLPEDLGAHLFHAPGWQWVDPTKEVQAAALAIELGLDTRTNVAARQGLHYEDIITARAREDALAEAAGVALSKSTLSRDPRPEQPAADDSRPRDAAA